MASIDFGRLERRTRARYEWGRAKRALLGLAPFGLVVAAAAMIGERPGLAVALGTVAFAWSALLLWYGRDARRAVLPGLAAGLVPLAFALCATLLDHDCAGNACVSVCIPACVMGGAVAGLTVAAVGHRRRLHGAYWLSASAIALLTGAMGCACAGYAGVLGMFAGYAAGFAPSALRGLFGGNN